MQERLKSMCGSYVTGPDFWGREDDIARLRQLIDGGANIVLVAQRRMGKTSLMKELQRQLSSQEDRPWLCLFIDLQGAQSPEEAITELAVELRRHQGWGKKIGHLIGNFLRAIRPEEIDIKLFRIKFREAVTSGDWREKGNELFDALAKSEKPVLLILDEIPILINRILMGRTRTITSEGPSRVSEFLSWLRGNSIRHQGKIRIILLGSIGLAPMLRRANLSAAINNFVPFELPPWDHITAARCLRALAQESGIRFTNDAEIAMVEKLGICIPYHVQLFFKHVHDNCCTARKNMLCGPDNVEAIYRKGMLGTSCNELSHYEERLKGAFDERDYSLIVDLLTEAATSPPLRPDTIAGIAEDSAAEKAAIEVILQTLMHDGYLRETPEGEYVFVSHLLRDWWVSRHSHGYVPIARRAAR
jgi:hypothetical protein